MYLQTAKTAGELIQLLRGIPENTPLCFVRYGKARPSHLNVGYGTDPNQPNRHIVLLDTGAARPMNGAK